MKRSILVPVCLAVVAACGELQTSPAAEPQQRNTARPTTPDEVQQRILEGNARFVAGTMRHPHEGFAWCRQQEKGQHPFITIVGCSDSRVPPELVFDVGVGDVFVIRVAGNVYDQDVAGSVEYAVEHLGTPLVLVLGHTCCGAVTAALEAAQGDVEEPQEIVLLLDRILPAIFTLDAELAPNERLSAAVEANVFRSVRKLIHTPFLRKAVEEERVKIAGAVYDLHSGEVRLLEPQESGKRGRKASAALAHGP